MKIDDKLNIQRQLDYTKELITGYDGMQYRRVNLKSPATYRRGDETHYVTHDSFLDGSFR